MWLRKRGGQPALAASPREPFPPGPCPAGHGPFAEEMGEPDKGPARLPHPGAASALRGLKRGSPDSRPRQGLRSRPGACRHSGAGRGMLGGGRAEGAPALSAQAHASRGLHWRGLLDGAFPAGLARFPLPRALAPRPHKALHSVSRCQRGAGDPSSPSTSRGFRLLPPDAAQHPPRLAFAGPGAAGGSGKQVAALLVPRGGGR